MSAVDVAAGLVLVDPMLLLLGVAVLLLLLAPLVRRRGPPTLDVAGIADVAGFASASSGSSSSSPPLPRTWRVRLRGLPRALELFGLLLIVVALARPARREPLPATRQGIDIVLCLDVSSSMTADGRLDAARDAAARFIRGRPDDRIGLVRFARFPDVACPPTLDHEALLEVLADVRPVEADGPEDATGIGTAVARAAQVLRSSSSNSKVVILLTDGAENVFGAHASDEIAPLHAAQLCERLGVRVNAIEVGPADSSGANGADASEATSLRRLAERTGGAFFVARDTQALAGIYARIDALEKVGLTQPRFVFLDRFQPFLIAAALLLLFGRLLARAGLEPLP